MHSQRVARYPPILKFYSVNYLGVQKMESMTTGLCQSCEVMYKQAMIIIGDHPGTQTGYVHTKTQVDINWILAQRGQGTIPWFVDENKPLKNFNKMSPRQNRV